jgi:hypothetical protein
LLQQITITGKVTDEFGSPIPGVNVVMKGTVQGTVTDTNGVYSLTVPDGNAIIMFSFVGYASQEPLVVIDGVAGSSLNNVAVDDIESIDILKDGSAAAI